MSDDIEGTDEVGGSDQGAGKHAGARQQAEAAERALADGDETRAADLLDQAQRTDPDGLADLLAEDGPAFPDDVGTAEDEEVAAISRQIMPGADAPSRAGITGSGSGADNMGE